jgi:DNA-binding GntR family transcriptional regulator
MAILRRNFGGRPRVEINPHQELVDALVGKDPDVIREAFRRHVGETSIYREFLASPAQDVGELTAPGGQRQ